MCVCVTKIYTHIIPLFLCLCKKILWSYYIIIYLYKFKEIYIFFRYVKWGLYLAIKKVIKILFKNIYIERKYDRYHMRKSLKCVSPVGPTSAKVVAGYLSFDLRTLLAIPQDTEFTCRVIFSSSHSTLPCERDPKTIISSSLERWTKTSRQLRKKKELNFLRNILGLLSRGTVKRRKWRQIIVNYPRP